MVDAVESLAKRYPELKPLAKLNERQQKGLKVVDDRRTISKGEYATLTNCSDATALRDLRELVKLEILMRVGKGRGAKYIRTQPAM